MEKIIDKLMKAGQATSAYPTSISEVSTDEKYKI